MGTTRLRSLALLLFVATLAIVAMLASEPAKQAIGQQPTPTIAVPACAASASAVGGVWAGRGSRWQNTKYSIMPPESILPNGEVSWDGSKEKFSYIQNRWYCNADQHQDDLESGTEWGGYRLLLAQGATGGARDSDEWGLEGYTPLPDPYTFRIMAAEWQGTLWLCQESAATCAAADPRVSGGIWTYTTTIGKRFPGGHWITDAGLVPQGVSWAFVTGYQFPPPTSPPLTPEPISTSTEIPGVEGSLAVAGVWTSEDITDNDAWAIIACGVVDDACAIKNGWVQWESAYRRQWMAYNTWYEPGRWTAAGDYVNVILGINQYGDNAPAWPAWMRNSVFSKIQLSAPRAVKVYTCSLDKSTCAAGDPRVPDAQWTYRMDLYPNLPAADASGTFDFDSISGGLDDGGSTSWALVVDYTLPTLTPSPTASATIIPPTVPVSYAVGGVFNVATPEWDASWRPVGCKKDEHGGCRTVDRGSLGTYIDWDTSTESSSAVHLRTNRYYESARFWDQWMLVAIHGGERGYDVPWPRTGSIGGMLWNGMQFFAQGFTSSPAKVFTCYQQPTTCASVLPFEPPWSYQQYLQPSGPYGAGIYDTTKTFKINDPFGRASWALVFGDDTRTPTLTPVPATATATNTPMPSPTGPTVTPGPPTGCGQYSGRLGVWYNQSDDWSRVDPPTSWDSYGASGEWGYDHDWAYSKTYPINKHICGTTRTGLKSWLIAPDDTAITATEWDEGAGEDYEHGVYYGPYKAKIYHCDNSGGGKCDSDPRTNPSGEWMYDVTLPEGLCANKPDSWADVAKCTDHMGLTGASDYYDHAIIIFPPAPPTITPTPTVTQTPTATFTPRVTVTPQATNTPGATATARADGCSTSSGRLGMWWDSDDDWTTFGDMPPVSWAAGTTWTDTIARFPVNQHICGTSYADAHDWVMSPRWEAATTSVWPGTTAEDFEQAIYTGGYHATIMRCEIGSIDASNNDQCTSDPRTNQLDEWYVYANVTYPDSGCTTDFPDFYPCNVMEMSQDPQNDNWAVIVHPVTPPATETPVQTPTATPTLAYPTRIPGDSDWDFPFCRALKVTGLFDHWYPAYQGNCNDEWERWKQFFFGDLAQADSCVDATGPVWPEYGSVTARFPYNDFDKVEFEPDWSGMVHAWDATIRSVVRGDGTVVFAGTPGEQDPDCEGETNTNAKSVTVVYDDPDTMAITYGGLAGVMVADGDTVKFGQAIGYPLGKSVTIIKDNESISKVNDPFGYDLASGDHWESLPRVLPRMSVIDPGTPLKQFGPPYLASQSFGCPSSVPCGEQTDAGIVDNSDVGFLCPTCDTFQVRNHMAYNGTHQMMPLTGNKSATNFARWQSDLPPGTYGVSVSIPSEGITGSGTWARAARYRIGEKIVVVDQQSVGAGNLPPAGRTVEVFLGFFMFKSAPYVDLLNAAYDSNGAGGWVDSADCAALMVDAAIFTPACGPTVGDPPWPGGPVPWLTSTPTTTSSPVPTATWTPGGSTVTPSATATSTATKTPGYPRRRTPTATPTHAGTTVPTPCSGPWPGCPTPKHGHIATPPE